MASLPSRAHMVGLPGLKTPAAASSDDLLGMEGVEHWGWVGRWGQRAGRVLGVWEKRVGMSDVWAVGVTISGGQGGFGEIVMPTGQPHRKQRDIVRTKIPRGRGLLGRGPRIRNLVCTICVVCGDGSQGKRPDSSDS